MEINLKDIYLSYEGLEKHPFKISKISKNGQVLKSLCLNHLTKPTDLVLLYYVNDVKEEVVVYENMTYNDLSRLTVIISKNGDKTGVSFNARIATGIIRNCIYDKLSVHNGI